MSAAAQDRVEPVDTDYDRMPANTVVPEYPEKARQERVEGEVQVCFDITREGFPQRVKVRHSTHRYFEKPARDAVRRSTWRPIPPSCATWPAPRPPSHACSQSRPGSARYPVPPA